MTEFLPEGSLYVFIGVASVLFAMIFGCFLYHKAKPYFEKQTVVPNPKKSGRKKSLKEGIRRNKFLRKKGERADADEEDGTRENITDKMKADIDAKYNNNNLVWMTDAAKISINSQTPQTFPNLSHTQEI